MNEFWRDVFSDQRLEKLAEKEILDEEVLPLVRKITMLGAKLPIVGRDYLIPDSTFAIVPGVPGEVPRRYMMDVIILAQIMIWSLKVPHGNK
jgi:radical SAM superfamily enzyme with C-terminal helix-hairpin-helix motif